MKLLNFDQFLNEGKKNPDAKVRNRKDPVFPAGSTDVDDDKDHFPLGDEDQARSALSYANKYKKKPGWFKGSLKKLVKKVASAVKRKYPNIDVTEASFKPGKG